MGARVCMLMCTHVYEFIPAEEKYVAITDYLGIEDILVDEPQ